MKKTAIIVGAGPAGLTAAYELLNKTDILPVIVEKELFAGGISRTVNYNGNRIDIGGHRFFSKSDEVIKIWQELMPIQGYPSKDDRLLGNKKPLSQCGPDPEKEDKVFLVRTRVSRILYLGKFFDYPISLKLKTFTNLGLRRTFSAGVTYIKSQIIKREEKTLEDFMSNRFGSSLYKMFFKDYTYKVWGKDPKDISPDWGAQRIKGLSLSKAILFMLMKPFAKKDLSQKNIETSLIELFLYPQKGPGQLWETMAEKVLEKGGKIYYQSKIKRFNFKDKKIGAVEINTQEGMRVLEADYFISSMPICDLITALNTNIPEKVRNIARNLPYRDFITVGILVDRLKIKNTTRINNGSDLIPDCWIYIQEPQVKMGRLQIFNNWSPYMVQDFENTVWIGLEYFCQENDSMWNQSDEEFIAFAVDEAVSIGIIERGSVLDSIRIKVEKAYPAYFGTYEEFDVVKQYVDEIPNLFCIGRNGQHRYNNMDHSMLTAIETVKIIKENYSNKSKIWSINAEADYHETSED